MRPDNEEDRAMGEKEREGKSCVCLSCFAHEWTESSSPIFLIISHASIGEIYERKFKTTTFSCRGWRISPSLRKANAISALSLQPLPCKQKKEKAGQ